MLFYNHKQEFIGIDDEGLKLLNYNSLEELLEVCSDAADLFAKEPGYIHNFKNFGWIDFLLHADSDASSAIVHANGRTFTCTLQVHKLYLCAEPSQSGYMVDMLHVVPVSGEEIAPRAPITAPKPSPEAKPAAQETVPESFEPVPSALPDYGYLTPTPLSEPGTLDIPAYGETEFETLPEPSEDLYEKPVFPEIEEELPLATPAPQQPQAVHPMPGGIRFSPAEQRFINELKVDRSYRFDPSVAANELGLPVDLIQEFIGDFIQQSHDFKDDLYDAVLKGDMNNLKILSHKLKGVAANLRIEDALECLTIINSSDDVVEIEANLKYFYGIIDKLEGKETAVMDDSADFFESESGTSYSEPFQEAGKAASFAETPEADNEPGPATSYSLDDDIYTFTIKEKVNEPSTPVEEEAPDYSLGLKHDEDESLIVHHEELAAMEDVGSTRNVPAEETFKEPLPAETALPDAEVAKLHYDKAAIAGQLGIESAFFDELVDDYKRDAQIAGQQIGDAINAFDTHLWKRTASQLKGISDNLRLSEISDELAILSHTNDAQEAHKASKRLTSYLAQL